LSSTAVIRFINGLFGTNYPPDSQLSYPNTETVTRDLRKIVSDTIMVINGTDVFHIETQINNDENMAVRMFRYGFEEGLKTKQTRGGIITVQFPQARVIYWETSRKTPDRLQLNLIFPDGTGHRYEVPAFKFLDYSVQELEARNMGILLPFYVLKLRKRVKAAKTGEERRCLSGEMKALMAELAETAERCTKAGLMEEGDVLSVLEHLDHLYQKLYKGYTEFREADEMLQEQFKYKWQEIQERALEQGRAEAQERALEQARKKILDLVRQGYTADQIEEMVTLENSPPLTDE
jgi:hypothetical protein